MTEFKKANSFWVWSNLFSGGLGKFYFFVHVGSGFRIVGLVSIASPFQFSFWRWSKFWLIIAFNYSACLSVMSLWQKFFASTLFMVGFAGSQNWLVCFGLWFWQIVFFIRQAGF